MSTKQQTIALDNATLARLKRAYEKAVKTKQVYFVFDDMELYTPYAKYLIEYMSSLLGAKTHD